MFFLNIESSWVPLKKYLKEIVEATPYEGKPCTYPKHISDTKEKKWAEDSYFWKKQATASARKTFAIMSGLDDTSVHLHK